MKIYDLERILQAFPRQIFRISAKISNWLIIRYLRFFRKLFADEMNI